MSDRPEIKTFTPPTHAKHWQENGGLLPTGINSSALWQFCLMAHQALEQFTGQHVLEGEEDITVRLKDLARSTLSMYRMPNELDGGMEILFQPDMIDLVKREARRCNLPWNSRLDAWFASGGRAYDTVTREAPN